MKLNTLKTSAASNGGSIRYRLYKNNNSSSKSAGLIFARSAPIGNISLSGLAEHIESDSKIEKGTVVAVLEASPNGEVFFEVRGTRIGYLGNNKTSLSFVI